MGAVITPRSRGQVSTPSGATGPLGRTSLAGADTNLRQGLSDLDRALERRARQKQATDIGVYSNRALDIIAKGEEEAKQNAPDEAGTHFEDNIADMRTRVLDGIKDPEVKQQVDIFATRQMIMRRSKLTSFQMARNESALQGATENGLLSLAQKRSQATSEVERNAFDAQAKHMTENFRQGSTAANAPEVSEAMFQKYRNKADYAQVLASFGNTIHSKEATGEVLSLLADPANFDALTPLQRQQLRAHGQNQLAAIEVEKRRQEAEARRKLKEAKVEAANSIYQRIETRDPTLTAQTILNDPVLDAMGPGGKKALLDYQRDVASGKEYRPDYGVFRSLVSSVLSGQSIDYTTQVAVQIGREGGLTVPQAVEIHNLIKRMEDPSTRSERQMLQQYFTNAQAQIDPSTIFKKNATGAANYYSFYVQSMARIRDGKAKGHSLYEMLDPGSSHFVGKDIGNFTFNATNQGQHMLRELQSGPPGFKPTVKQRAPGESIQDYMKRNR